MGNKYTRVVEEIVSFESLFTKEAFQKNWIKTERSVWVNYAQETEFDGTEKIKEFLFRFIDYLRVEIIFNSCYNPNWRVRIQESANSIELARNVLKMELMVKPCFIQEPESLFIVKWRKLIYEFTKGKSIKGDTFKKTRNGYLLSNDDGNSWCIFEERGYYYGRWEEIFTNGLLRNQNGIEYEGTFGSNQDLIGAGKIIYPNGWCIEGFFDKLIFIGETKYFYYDKLDHIGFSGSSNQNFCVSITNTKNSLQLSANSRKRSIKLFSLSKYMESIRKRVGPANRMFLEDMDMKIPKNFPEIVNIFGSENIYKSFTENEEKIFNYYELFMENDSFGSYHDWYSKIWKNKYSILLMGSSQKKSWILDNLLQQDISDEIGIFTASSRFTLLTGVNSQLSFPNMLFHVPVDNKILNRGINIIYTPDQYEISDLEMILSNIESLIVIYMHERTNIRIPNEMKLISLHPTIFISDDHSKYELQEYSTPYLNTANQFGFLIPKFVLDINPGSDDYDNSITEFRRVLYSMLINFLYTPIKFSIKTESSIVSGRGFIHHGISCSSCEQSPIIGSYFECLVCNENLCNTCSARAHSHHVQVKCKHPSLIKEIRPINIKMVMKCDICASPFKANSLLFQCCTCESLVLCESCSIFHNDYHHLLQFALDSPQKEYNVPLIDVKYSFESVKHTGVTCSVCHEQHFDGVKYQCVDCNEVVCGKCDIKEYHKSHFIMEIKTPTLVWENHDLLYNSDFKEYINRCKSQVISDSEFICFRCNQIITDDIYKCCICILSHLCADCKKIEISDHPFLRIPRPYLPLKTPISLLEILPDPLLFISEEQIEEIGNQINLNLLERGHKRNLAIDFLNFQNNHTCADCLDGESEYYSLLGFLLCQRCASIHESYSLLDYVRPISKDLDKDISKELKVKGNLYMNNLFEHNIPSFYERPHFTDEDYIFKHFICSKYIDKWFTGIYVEIPEKQSYGYKMNKKKVWQKRYMVLTETTLRYYENRSSKKCKGSIELNEITDIHKKVYSMNYLPNCITIHHNGRTYPFSYSTKDLMLDWYYCIQFHIYQMGPNIEKKLV